MNDIPEDPMMFVSFANTELRDFYPTLAEFCKAHEIDENTAKERADAAGFEYDEGLNKFV